MLALRIKQYILISMIIFSLREDRRKIETIPDSGFFLEGGKNLCFLIHGLTGTAKEMSSIGQKLNKEGYSVASPMILGHNQSISVLKRKKWQELYQGIKSEFLKYESSYEKRNSWIRKFKRRRTCSCCSSEIPEKRFEEI